MSNEIEFTKSWWKRCIADDAKMTAWLQKLQRTEYSGYTDHIVFLETHVVSERERKIIQNIAEDELIHSGLLLKLFEDRKILADPLGEQSTYWDEILSNITNVSEYCAANYYGEAIAAFRFEVILSMPETPSDIREVIQKVLPDEVFHRETLQRLAGDETLSRMKTLHDAAYNRVRGIAA